MNEGILISQEWTNLRLISIKRVLMRCLSPVSIIVSAKNTVTGVDICTTLSWNETEVSLMEQLITMSQLMCLIIVDKTSAQHHILSSMSHLCSGKHFCNLNWRI